MREPFKIHKKSLGFTLVEICVAIAILGFVIAAGAVFFTNIYSLWLDNSDQIEVQQNARIAMDEMSKYIRQASSPTITLSDMTDSVLISRYDATEPLESLIRFHLLDWTTIQFFQMDGKLYRRRDNPDGSTMETEITDNLSQLYFIKENPQGMADDYCIYVATFTLQRDEQAVSLQGYIHLKNP
ncbi:MAG: prepilin-type N-terminal cleavage/methylation domain-containing protein [bacterium]